MFGLVFFFIASQISFAFYRELHVANNLYCSTMYECALTTLHSGLIVGIYEVLNCSFFAGLRLSSNTDPPVCDLLYFFFLYLTLSSDVYYLPLHLFCGDQGDGFLYVLCDQGL